MAFNSIFGWIIKKRMNLVHLFKNNPMEVQQECFEYLISKGKDTTYGREYGFDLIKSYIDFRQSVPLQEYEDIKPWVERETAGEPNVLWPGETLWFAKSSGTTSDRSKYIPVTKESLEDCHYKGGKDLLAIYYNHFPNAKIYKGKHLVVGGSAEQIHLRENSYSGDLSAIILKNLPWWVEMKRTPSKETALMSKWEQKIERLADETMEEDVYSISGVPSWTLVLFHKILEKTGKSNMREVWPNLELFMHGGVSLKPYKNEFKKLIPFGDMHYIESYNASEGFFGIQDEIGGDLLLMLDYGIFYEFIPMNKFEGKSSKEVLSLKDVRPHTNYALVISTNGGLWRYILGDTIKFSSVQPYRFTITGRTKNYINVFGEELMVDNADRAIKNASEETGALIREYTACPIYMQEGKHGGHEWLIEFSKLPNDLKRFTAIMDYTLREVNSDYDAKRTNDLTINFPVVHVARKGLFEDWLRTKNKLGGQHKIPRLSNSRTIFEELISLDIKEEINQRK